jgi:hypothetical protein
MAVRRLSSGRWQLFTYSPDAGKKVYRGTFATEAEARHADALKIDGRAKVLRPMPWSLASKGEPACRLCGRDADHLHHLIPQAEPGSRADVCPTVGGIPLCHTCHTGWHHGAVTIPSDVLSQIERDYVVAVLGRDWLGARYPPRVAQDQVARSAIQSVHDLIAENERLRRRVAELEADL